MREPISIIIPVYNDNKLAVEYTDKAIESAIKYMLPNDEVIVVDDCSPIPYEPYDEEGLCLIRQETNGGFGVSCNTGFQLAGNPWIAQMNSDCALVEDTFGILQEVMQRHDLAVGMPEHKENCEHYGLGKSMQLMGSDWRFGALWLARRGPLLEMGGFDTAYEGAYWEDYDLWKRLEAAGYKVSGWRGTWVSHKGNVSTGSLLKSTDVFEKNRLLYESRWAG